MIALLTMLKSKLFWASLVLIACATLTGYFWISNSHLEAQVAKLTGQVTTAQVTIDEKTKAAQLCSDNTKDLMQREKTLSAQVSAAQLAAKSAAAVHTQKAKQILTAKPASDATDAQAAEALLNSLIPGK